MTYKRKIILTLLMVLLIFYHESLADSQYDLIQNISKAFSDVIFEFFIAQDINFDFIIFGESSNHINDVICKVMKNVSVTTPINILHISDVNNWDGTLNNSAMIFVKTFSNLQILHEKSKIINIENTQRENLILIKLKFLTYCEECKAIEDFDNIFLENMPGKNELIELAFFEIFIIHSHNAIILILHEIFSENNCASRSLSLLNFIMLDTQEWDEKLTNYDFFSDFNGCILSFIVKVGYRFYFADNINADTARQNYVLGKNEKIDGILYEIIDVMSKRYNFTPHYIIDIFDYVLFSKNFAPVNGFVNVFKIDFEPRLEADRLFHFIYPTYETKFYFLISLNDLYTNYEKLVFPFDFPTWLLMIFTFGLTFGSIFGLQFSPRWFRLLFVGKGKLNIYKSRQKN